MTKARTLRTVLRLSCIELASRQRFLSSKTSGQCFCAYVGIEVCCKTGEQVWSHLATVGTLQLKYTGPKSTIRIFQKYGYPQQAPSMPSKKCEAEGCGKWASFNVPGTKRPQFCRPHSTEGMVNVVSRQRCHYPDCPKQANFNHRGETRGLYCKEHIEEGMIDVRHKHCMHPGCPKQATCNSPGSGGGMYCGQHKLEGMVNVVLKRCAYMGCETFPSFGLPGQPGVQYCRLHKLPGMQRRRSNAPPEEAGGPEVRCAHPGCLEPRPIFCLSHLQDGMGHDPLGNADAHLPHPDASAVYAQPVQVGYDLQTGGPEQHLAAQGEAYHTHAHAHAGHPHPLYPALGPDANLAYAHHQHNSWNGQGLAVDPGSYQAVEHQ